MHKGTVAFIYEHYMLQWCLLQDVITLVWCLTDQIDLSRGDYDSFICDNQCRKVVSTKVKSLYPTLLANITLFISVCTLKNTKRQCVHIFGPSVPGYIRIFVTIDALLVIALCTRLRITQQGNNGVQYCALVSDVTLVRVSNVPVNACSATIERHRHRHPSSHPSWDLRHDITFHRPVNLRHTETRQFNYSTLRGHCTHQLRHQLTMESTRRQQLTRMRAVAKLSLIRMQTFIETGDHKLNDIQVRFEELPNIFNKFEAAQNELELSDDADHSVDRQQFEEQYFEVKTKFNELLHPVVDLPLSRHRSPRSSLSGHNNSHSPQSPASGINIKLPLITLPTSEGETCSWLHYRDTFGALIVNNSTLSNVQKFHYLIASLKNEAKDLISNMQITN